MSSTEISALMTLLSIIQHLSSWPFGVLISVVVIGPWTAMFMFWRIESKRIIKQDKANQAGIQIVLEQYRNNVSEIKRLYESNVRLVEDSNKAFNRLEKIYDETISVISLNTQTQTHLADQIKNNQYCPAIRRVNT